MYIYMPIPNSGILVAKCDAMRYIHHVPLFDKLICNCNSNIIYYIFNLRNFKIKSN